LLAGLKSEEAALVLRQLLAAHPDLEAEAERIARSLLQGVDFESVADEVEDEIQARLPLICRLCKPCAVFLVIDR
jgi:hypothetical protein